MSTPDIAGEDFAKLYELGRFPSYHSELLREADHIVLFQHVGNYDVPGRLKPPGKVSSGDSSRKSDPVEWEPALMYPDPKLVAMMMGIQEICEAGIPRLSVVLTAWDLIKKDSSPQKILRERFPLVHQYLSTNFTEYRLLGLSAQGCDYRDSDSVDAITLDDVSRIRVVSGSGGEEHCDITQVFT